LDNKFSSESSLSSLLRGRLWEEEEDFDLLLLLLGSSKIFSSSRLKAPRSSPELLLLLDLLREEDLEFSLPLLFLLREASKTFSSSWVGGSPPPFSLLE